MTFWIKHDLNFKHIKNKLQLEGCIMKTCIISTKQAVLILADFEAKAFLMVAVSEIDCAGWWFNMAYFKKTSVIVTVQNS